MMNVGTKSVLFGAHQFAIHPWFVAAGWYKLYGFPWDPRLWVAFFVHDVGYFGKPNMDGPEGELHPHTGANIMRIFGQEWHDFSLYHSRFLAKQHGKHFSKLCVADKLAICLTPAWLYLPMTRATGEIKEYMKDAAIDQYKTMNLRSDDQLAWFNSVKVYLRKWVEEHKDMREDTWTPVKKEALDEHGVWK